MHTSTLSLESNDPSEGDIRSAWPRLLGCHSSFTSSDHCHLRRVCFDSIMFHQSSSQLRQIDSHPRMERNNGSCVASDGSTGCNDGVGEVPARSSSAPPHHPGAVFTPDAANSTALTDANAHTTLTLNPSSILVEPDTLHSSSRASPTADEQFLYSYLTNESIHQTSFAGSTTSSSEPWSCKSAILGASRRERVHLWSMPLTFCIDFLDHTMALQTATERRVCLAYPFRWGRAL